MHPNINPNENNVMYHYPTPPPPPQKKTMTPGKWVAIFVPIGILALALTVFMTVFTVVALGTKLLKEVAKTEQYEVALDYLIESDILREIETEDTTLTLTGYQSSRFNDQAKYKFTFQTQKATYQVVVRDDGDGPYVSEEECSYTRFMQKEHKNLPISGRFSFMI